MKTNLTGRMKRNNFRLAIVLSVLFVHALAACADVHDQKAKQQTPKEIPVYTYKLVNLYPHDPEAFTQGLLYESGFLYESTGLYGKSDLRKINPETGDVLQIHKLPEKHFGEGITIYNNTIIQLTWKSGTGLVYDRESFKLLRTFDYPTQGWGITHDGKNIIMSDGTSSLYLLDPHTFRQTRTIKVHDGNGPVTRLNELEYINGTIYANIWQSYRIAMISPATGMVTGWIDLEGLAIIAGGDKKKKVLNGIAYDRAGDRLFVTGKLWPTVFEIEILPLPQ